MPAVLFFGHHCVQAILAVGVAAGCEKPWEVVAAILIPADGAVEFGVHCFSRIYIIKNKHIAIIPVLKLMISAK